MIKNSCLISQVAPTTFGKTQRTTKEVKNQMYLLKTREGQTSQHSQSSGVAASTFNASACMGMASCPSRQWAVPVSSLKQKPAVTHVPTNAKS